MRADPAIELIDVSFAYDGYEALRNVSLVIREGELCCVVGPNGGGKTTLLRLMLGALKPTRGEIRVFGLSPNAARARVGYMPQHSRYDPQFPVTVMDVVLMARAERRLGWRYTSADKSVAARCLEEVEMGGFSGRLFNALSGGQRQRVLLARALACEPQLLLLDEPTANVDVVVEDKLYSILKALGERMTIVMVSHDLGFVSDIVQSVICVNRRVVVHPTSNITGEVIRDIYGGDMRIVRHDHRCSEEGHKHG
ncbi:MAG TPA: ABC transporter ATP-binding protein [Candidatus Brocadiia bacterium]|nr:ABC transporter ATP-binding protein [Candidatus Brocadiia bacterium]